MSVGEICNREAVICSSGESILDVARLMREYHVGDVVVVTRTDSGNRPVGILTDRDIVIEIVAKEVDAASLKAGDVMQRDLVVVTEDSDLLSTIELMRDKGVRRLPVVNSEGHLEGVVTVDDLLELIAEQLDDLVGLIRHEIRDEVDRR